MVDTPSEIARAASMAGRIQALMCFALTVAEIYPDRPLLRKAFEIASQVGLAKIEMTLASERTVDGYQDVVGKILQILSDREES